MKTILLSLSLAATLFVACNNSGSDKKLTDSTTSVSNEESTPAQPLSNILGDYLEIKNALTKDNDSDAASAATKLAGSLQGFDKTALNADQTKVYNDIEADAIEHAEHIASNKGNLVHQREHFETLSAEMYELVKVMGAGQKLYYTNCPMYNENKGANWLSESKEVSNPYLGQAMLTCGTVKEELN